MDCSVGAIVWVRRRNGSWWPGRILGQDELSASHLMSPRSGTPVKLLGREDASVDWYNLEKSKRVKAFRCGEFDACIERAEASQGVLTKKREKYARREDAILHALELEKQQKSGANTNSISRKYSGGSRKELNNHSSSELRLKDYESMARGNSVNQRLKSNRKVDLSSEEVSGSSLLNAQKRKNDKQMNWEDDNSEAMPRMRGLQDFGLRIAPSKRKGFSPAACENPKNALINNYVDVIPDSGHFVGSVNSVGSGKNPSVDKRKKSHDCLMEEYLLKRHDRRRPLVQVFQNSAKLPASQSLQADCESVSVLGQEENEHMGTICHDNRTGCMCLTADCSDCLDHTGCYSDKVRLSPTLVGCSNGLHQPHSLVEEDTSSGLVKEDVNGSLERDFVDDGVEDDITLFQDCTSIVPGSRNLGRHVGQGVSTLGDQEQLGKICDDDEETSTSDCKAVTLSNDEAAGSVDMGISKWHLKGKRNIRNLTKKSMQVLDGKISVMHSDNSNGYLSGLLYKKYKKRGISKMGQEHMSGQGFHKVKEENLTYDDDDEESEEDLENRFGGFGKRCNPLMTKAGSKGHEVHGISNSDDDSHEMFSSAWQVNEPPQLAQMPYWLRSDECLGPPFVHPLSVEMEPLLVDVNLKVQASYQGEHVPLVSLMSRLNGKAIIGHPVYIEILENVSTYLPVPRTDKGPDTIDGAEHATPPHVWRTGRRTAMQRVPRPHLVPSALEDEEGELIPLSDTEGRPLFRKPYIGTPQATLLKTSSHQHLRASGKSHKKHSKKGSLSSQKTRRLSSFAFEQKRKSMDTSAKQRNGRGVLDGLIKPSGTVPLVTCVPVKVVFSRLLEAVGRPASAGTTCHGLFSGSAIRNPS